MNRLILVYALGLAGSLLLLSIAYFYFQLYLDLIPCPLCMFQRAVLVFVALVCVVGLLHRPDRRRQKIYSVAVLTGSLLGILFSARQVWLQYFPAPPGASCGVDPIYRWTESIGDNFGFLQMFGSVLKGSGDCSEIDWSLLGVSMGGWMLVIFLAMAALSIFLTLKPLDVKG